jgi:hypothetical protein
MFCDHINIDNLEYKPPASNRSGGKVVNVSTVPGSKEWDHRIRFQMSESQSENIQNAVWGLSTPLPGQDSARRTLELSIESDKLLDFLQKLDERNVNVAVQNSTEWFKKELTEDAIKNMYVYLVKQPMKDGQKPSVRVKVKTGDYPTNIFVVQEQTPDNIQYTRGGPEDLTKNCKCLVVVESVGLWFMSRQYGMSLTATEILVWPNKRQTGIDAFTLDKGVKTRKIEESPEMPVSMEEDF